MTWEFLRLNSNLVLKRSYSFMTQLWSNGRYQVRFNGLPTIFRGGASLLSTFHRNYLHRKTLSIIVRVKCYKLFLCVKRYFLYIYFFTTDNRLMFFWGTKTICCVFIFPYLLTKLARIFFFKSSADFLFKVLRIFLTRDVFDTLQRRNLKKFPCHCSSGILAPTRKYSTLQVHCPALVSLDSSPIDDNYRVHLFQ